MQSDGTIPTQLGGTTLMDTHKSLAFGVLCKTQRLVRRSDCKLIVSNTTRVQHHFGQSAGAPDMILTVVWPIQETRWSQQYPAGGFGVE
jgi:hypothetical protein